MLFRLFVCITCILIASNHLFLLSFNTLILSLCEQAHLPTVLKSRLVFFALLHIWHKSAVGKSLFFLSLLLLLYVCADVGK